MKRFAIIAALTLLMGIAGEATAQRLTDVPDLTGKIIYGGTIGGGLSGRYLNLSLAPQIGYRVFNPWEVGVRGSYSLQCQFDQFNGTLSSHYFGVGPYTNFQIYKGLFVHVEDEVMYGFTRWNHETSAGHWFNTLFAGGGYRQYTRAGSYAYFLILYNLSWNVIQIDGWQTPYGSPFTIRVGYCF